jgi:RHS repeat-associated protein
MAMLTVAVPPAAASVLVQEAIATSHDLAGRARPFSLRNALSTSVIQGNGQGRGMPPPPPTPKRAQPQRPPTKAEREARVFKIQLNVETEQWVAPEQKFAIGGVPFDKDGRPVHGLTVEWSTSDREIVFVTKDGRAIAGRHGSARLIARAGKKQASVKVNVYDNNQGRSENAGSGSIPRNRKKEFIARAGKSKILFAHPFMPSGTDDRLPDSDTSSLYQPINQVGTPEGKTEAPATTPPAATGGTETPGSANYSFAVPLLDLPGRQLNTGLSLNYNSRLWHKVDNGSTTKMYYDVDYGWPAPGFRVGFGQLEHQGSSGFTLTEANGTRRQMTSIGSSAYRTTDGSLITYYSALGGGTMTYPDGTHVSYGATNGPRFYPTRVTDRQGNIIEIDYVGGTGPKISTITDTLGRYILFHYSGNDLIAITSPGYDGGADRQVARFYYETISLPICCDTYTLFAYGIQVNSASTARVLRYVYLPGTQNGYRYDYSSYGMIYKVFELRGMTVDNNLLTSMGAVTSDGDIGATSEYNYPFSPGGLSDVPQYTTRMDTWAGSTVDTPPVWTFASNPATGISTVTSPGPENTVTETQSDPTTGLVQSVTVKYQSSVLSKNVYTWESSTGGPRMQKVETTNEAQQTRATTLTYDPNTIFNNVSVVSERDFAAAGTLGAELRRVETTYENSQSYADRGLIHLPLTIKVFAGGSSAPASYAAYTYDQGTLLDRPNIVMFDPAYNPNSEWSCTWECREWDYWQIDCVSWNEHCEPVYDRSTSLRGNATTITSYADAANSGGATSNTMSYDIAGNMVEATVNCCRRKTFAYSDDYSNSYVTSQSRGETGQLSTSATYDFNTGLPRTAVNENDRTTTIHYDPVSLRTSAIDRPQGSTTFAYVDQLLPDPDAAHKHSYVLTTTQRDGSTSISSYQRFDGRGALVRSFSGFTPAQGWVTQDVEYDEVGRAKRSSQPYYSDGSASAINPSGLWATNVYDRLNRMTSASSPSGDAQNPTTSTASVTYAGTVITTSDAAQRQGRQILDALGRLIYVDEPDLDGNLGTVTSPAQRTAYEYDALNNLTKITQGSQVRQFKYDSLSQLTHEKQIERDAKLNDNGVYISGGSLWTGVYAYNSSGLMTDAYDAKGIHTQFTYDTLNRRKTVSRSGESTQTPTTSYTYGDELNPVPADSKDRVAKIETAAGGSTPTTAQEFDYDLLGRPNTQRQKIGSTTYTLGYTYNYLGQLKTSTQPSGRVITYDYDVAARLVGVSDSANRISASGLTYAAHSGLTTETWGNSGIQNISYNRGLQPQTLSLSRSGSEVQRFDYKYGVANISSGTVDESKNTGQVARIEGFIGGVKQWQQRYTYDSVNRLSKASEVRGDDSQQVWQTAYTYDRWGNRFQSGSDNSGAVYEPVVGSDINPANNRFISTGQKPINYDDAGQIISDSRFRSMQYQYEADGRMRWAARLDGTGAITATFDGSGQRVQTILNGSTRNFVYNLFGQLVAEYRSGVLDREYIYQAGGLLATDEQPRSCSVPTDTFVSNFFSGALNPQTIGSQSQWETSLNQAMSQGFNPLLTQAQSLGTALFNSTDYVNQGRSNTQFVTDLYSAYLQRGPDQEGLDFWVYQLTNNGASREVIRGEFARSLEFQYKVKGVCSTLGSVAAVKYVFMDQQGSTRALMDGNGSVLSRHDYLPFGEELWANTGMRTTTQQFGAMDQSRARYALTYKDEATGLDHTWFRKYENASGRWTGPDPLAGNAAYPQSLNAYTYGNNDPVNLTDPTGLEPALCIVDGFVTNCNTAGMFVNAGIGARAPLTTTRFNPDANGGQGEMQLLRFVGQNLGWYNSEGHTITAMAWLEGDGVFNFAGGATWKVSYDNPYDPVNVIQAGLSDRWPPSWPPPGDNFGWKPPSPPTVRPPVMQNPNLDNAKNRVGAPPNLEDEMNKVKPGRFRPKGAGGGLLRAVGEILDLFKFGAGGCLVPPVVWTPEMECAVLRKCGIQN